MWHHFSFRSSEHVSTPRHMRANMHPYGIPPRHSSAAAEGGPSEARLLCRRSPHPRWIGRAKSLPTAGPDIGATSGGGARKTSVRNRSMTALAAAFLVPPAESVLRVETSPGLRVLRGVPLAIHHTGLFPTLPYRPVLERERGDVGQISPAREGSKWSR